jgi:DNA-binding NarL/FixJ family response regulator
MTFIKIVIVEQDKDLRNRIKEFLNNAEGIQCMGGFAKAEDLMGVYKDIKADVVLIDISLPGISGIQCIAKLKPLKQKVQFLVWTAYEDPEKIFDSLCNGATGYILKKSPPEKLLEAIRDIYNGGSPMSSKIARMVVSSFPDKNQYTELLKTFTTREQEILLALAKGYQYREIASLLLISIETVRTYLRKIYVKLQVHSKVAALNKVFPKKM